jgi:hypothetical protein
MSRDDREARARKRRRSADLRKTRLRAAGSDPFPVRGVEALSLVTRPTMEAWSLGGREVPGYARAETPCRFVPSGVT